MDILWVDLETTGLEPDAEVLEVAALVTDFSGSIKDSYHRVFPLPQNVMMNTNVVRMHQKSGLLNACLIMEEEGISNPYPRFTFVDEDLAQMTPRGAYLGGSSVGFDRHYITRDLPLLTERLHYRNIDSSTLKNTAKFAGVTFDEPDSVAHRAMDDIKVSLNIYIQARQFFMEA